MEDSKILEEGFGTGPQPAAKNEQLDAAHGISTETTTEVQPLKVEKSKRVATLDAFRGLTIVVPNYKTYILI